MNLIQVTESFVRDCLPVRDRNGHKGTFGRVHILAGCVGFTGAPAFASAAAVRTGSGLVFLSVPREIWPVLAVKCREAMPSPVPPFPVLLEKMNGSDGVLIGPGLGRSRKTCAFFYNWEELRDLSRPDQDGFLDPLLGILDLVPVFPAVPQQAGQGNVVALEVAVVDPEDSLADPDVAVDGLVGALLEIQFPLAGDWVAAQGDVPPGPLVGDEHVVG